MRLLLAIIIGNIFLILLLCIMNRSLPNKEIFEEASRIINEDDWL